MANRKAKSKQKRSENPIIKEYKRQRERIQRFLRTKRKQGFIFPENILPSIPKKITQASVHRLEKKTPTELYKKATYIFEEDGKTIQLTGRKGEQKRRQEKRAKKKQKKYPQLGDIVLDNIIEEWGGETAHVDFQKYTDEYDKFFSEMEEEPSPFARKREAYYQSVESQNIILAALAMMAQRIGKNKLGELLHDNSEIAERCRQAVLYGSTSDAVRNGQRELLAIIMQRPLDKAELEDLEELAQQDENNDEFYYE